MTSFNLSEAEERYCLTRKQQTQQAVEENCRLWGRTKTCCGVEKVKPDKQHEFSAKGTMGQNSRVSPQTLQHNGSSALCNTTGRKSCGGNTHLTLTRGNMKMCCSILLNTWRNTDRAALLNTVQLQQPVGKRSFIIENEIRCFFPSLIELRFYVFLFFFAVEILVSRREMNTPLPFTLECFFSV